MLCGPEAPSGLEKFTDFPLVGKATSPDPQLQEPGAQKKVQVPARPDDLQVPLSEHLLCRHHRGSDHHHRHLHQPHLLGALQQVSNLFGQQTNHSRSATDPGAKNIAENGIRAASIQRAREKIKSLQLNVMRRVGFCKGGGGRVGGIHLEGGNASPKRR